MTRENVSAVPANNRRGGAPRGERPALRDARRLAKARLRASSRAKRLRAYVTGPRRCSQAPERLSALRPSLWWGKLANLGGMMPRERNKRMRP